MTKNIISQIWLVDKLQDPQIVIVDCRFTLGKPNEGILAYEHDHIPGAVYLDLEKDLSGPKGQYGGRHPLPNITELSHKLGKIGIDQDRKVIAYDDQGGAMAARLWFLLKYLGQENVYVLDEGYSKWKEKGYPVSAEVKIPEKTTFTPKIQSQLLVQMEDVKKRLDDDRTVIIDSRSADRYRGENETIDPVSGHIPGAANEFWMESLKPTGAWKSKEELEQRLNSYLQAQDEGKEIILYCGSGVTACANMLAFDEIGLKPKLYLGSWSDWISYENNPIEK